MPGLILKIDRSSVELIRSRLSWPLEFAFDNGGAGLGQIARD